MQLATASNPFADRLVAGVAQTTPCVIGLDPDIASMAPEWLSGFGYQADWPRQRCADLLYEYGVAVLDAVHDLVSIVKPQAACYERYGSFGMLALERTIAHARELDLLVLLDAKRGDIPAIGELYAAAYLMPDRGESQPLADAMTVSPYLGADSLEPFVAACKATGSGVFVCVKTSNPGAAGLQNLIVNGRHFYEQVADLVAGWAADSIGDSGYSSIGAVVGATWPDDARRLRRQMPHSIFLVPGIGAQGGVLTNLPAFFHPGGRGAVVAASRSVLYPHHYGNFQGPTLKAVRAAAVAFTDGVTAALKER
jgi:orotidine-5'-phosphate decarboxylase